MKSIAILHEGAEDIKLIKSFLDYLGLNKDSVEFYCMGRKNNFFNINFVAYRKLKECVTKGEVKKILFIIDADDEKKSDASCNGFESTCNKLNETISTLGLKEFSSIYIMHDPRTKDKIGNVEAFILSTIDDDKMKFILNFLECYEFNPKNGDKSTYKRIYEPLASPIPKYDFRHPNYAELKSKLKALFE